MAGADQALGDLVAAVRDDDTLLSEHLREPEGDPALGRLAAAGPRAAGAEPEYAFVVEAIREGYLLHYGVPRILEKVDSDLALLAGDHLYALGLERLAGLGDLEAVRELGDLISLCAVLQADGAAAEPTARRAVAGIVGRGGRRGIRRARGGQGFAARRDPRSRPDPRPVGGRARGSRRRWVRERA